MRSGDRGISVVSRRFEHRPARRRAGGGAPGSDQPVLPDHPGRHVGRRTQPQRAATAEQPARFRADGPHGIHGGLRAGSQLDEVAHVQIVGGAESCPRPRSGHRGPPRSSSIRPTTADRREQTYRRAVALRAAGTPSRSPARARRSRAPRGMPADGVLQLGDVIVAVDGQPSRDHGWPDAQPSAPPGRRSGDLSIRRDGQPKSADR